VQIYCETYAFVQPRNNISLLAKQLLYLLLYLRDVCVKTRWV